MYEPHPHNYVTSLMGVSAAMKVVSWNVNGLRAVLKNRDTKLKQFLDSFSADIICLQEVKGTSKLSTVATVRRIEIIIVFCSCRSSVGTRRGDL